MITRANIFSASQEVEMIDGFVQSRQTFGRKDFCMLCCSLWTEAEALACAHLGKLRFYICILGRLERVCHLDKREKVAVTAGPKMARDT